MNASNFLNLVGFQIGWLATVMGAAYGYPWIGPLYAVSWLTWHLRRLESGAAAELRLLLAAAVLGYIADSLLVLAGVIEFPPETRLGAPSTVWMVALWTMFAATLGHSLVWLRGRLALAAAFGAVGGPLAYWAGQRLDALILGDGVFSLLIIGVEWALATPLLLALASWFDDRTAARRDLTGERA